MHHNIHAAGCQLQVIVCVLIEDNFMNLKLPGNQFLCDAWIRCDTCTCRTAVKYFACFMVEKCIPRITFVIATAEQNALNGADIATYASAILVATTFFSIKIKQAKAY